MASWVTDEKGYWHPAKEKVALKNLSGKRIEIKQKDKDGKEFSQVIEPGDDYIYEGPCRQALFELWEIDKTGKTTTLGDDFRKNIEFMEAYGKFRAMFGFSKVEEYLAYIGYDEKAVKEEFEKKASKVSKHELPKRIQEIKKLGGGKDTVDGKLNKYGGFGAPELVAA